MAKKNKGGFGNKNNQIILSQYLIYMENQFLDMDGPLL